MARSQIMSDSKQGRRHRTAEEKAVILRRHLQDKVPVSDICNEEQLQPSLFYEWMRALLANAPAALEGSTRRKTPAADKGLEAKVAQLERKLARKDEVIAEISEEYVRLKKELGEP